MHLFLPKLFMSISYGLLKCSRFMAIMAAESFYSEPVTLDKTVCDPLPAKVLTAFNLHSWGFGTIEGTPYPAVVIVIDNLTTKPVSVEAFTSGLKFVGGLNVR